MAARRPPRADEPQPATPAPPPAPSAKAPGAEATLDEAEKRHLLALAKLLGSWLCGCLALVVVEVRYGLESTRLLGWWVYGTLTFVVLAGSQMRRHEMEKLLAKEELKREMLKKA